MLTNFPAFKVMFPVLFIRLLDFLSLDKLKYNIYGKTLEHKMFNIGHVPPLELFFIGKPYKTSNLTSLF